MLRFKYFKILKEMTYLWLVLMKEEQHKVKKDIVLLKSNWLKYSKKWKSISKKNSLKHSQMVLPYILFMLIENALNKKLKTFYKFLMEFLIFQTLFSEKKWSIKKLMETKPFIFKHVSFLLFISWIINWKIMRVFINT